MTFEEARARFVTSMAVGGGYKAWPEGYEDGASNQRYLGTVGEVSVFEVYAKGATQVDLWSSQPHGPRHCAHLTVREAYALAALLTGGSK